MCEIGRNANNFWIVFLFLLSVKYPVDKIMQESNSKKFVNLQFLPFSSKYFENCNIAKIVWSVASVPLHDLLYHIFFRIFFFTNCVPISLKSKYGMDNFLGLKIGYSLNPQTNLFYAFRPFRTCEYFLSK